MAILELKTVRTSPKQACMDEDRSANSATKLSAIKLTVGLMITISLDPTKH